MNVSLVALVQSSDLKAVCSLTWVASQQAPEHLGKDSGEKTWPMLLPAVRLKERVPHPNPHTERRRGDKAPGSEGGDNCILECLGIRIMGMAMSSVPTKVPTSRVILGTGLCMSVHIDR